jgi:putative transposase
MFLMPPKNQIKQYAADGYYHIYNRGVEKRIIFKDDLDYKVFLSYLKQYLSPLDTKELDLSKDKDKNSLLRNNYADKIKLLAYCLMPNHFHLLVKQGESRTIESFMKSLSTRYVIYFNRRHKRVGRLFQGIYKAVLVKTDEQLLHLSRYIHLNPVIDGKLSIDKTYSSLADYLGKRKTKWLQTKEVLSFYSQNSKELTYDNFIFDYLKKEKKGILNKDRKKSQEDQYIGHLRID